MVDACWVKSSFVEKDLVVLMDTKLKKSLHCALVEKTTNFLLGWIRKNMRRPKKVILPLCSPLVWHVYSVRFRSGLSKTTTREMCTWWTDSCKGLWRFLCKIYTRSGWDSWVCLAWRRCRAGSFKMYKYLIKGAKKMEPNCWPWTGLSGHNGQEAKTKIK